MYQKVQEWLRANRVDAWLVLGPEVNSEWLLGRSVSDRHAVVVPRSGKTVIVGPEVKGPFKDALTKALKRYRRIAVDYNDKPWKFSSEATSFLSHSQYLALRKITRAHLVSAHNLQVACRSVKTSKEIQLITKAVRVTESVVQKIIHQLRGLSEAETAAVVLQEFARRNCGSAFPPIVAFGPGTADVHHVPGARKVKMGDAVMIDIGARYRGYCGDLTRTFCFGPALREFRQTYALVKEAQTVAAKMLKAGATAEDIDKAARDFLAKEAKYFVHGLGHPLGVVVHDVGPSMGPKYEERKWRLQRNQVMTVEPGLYYPRKFGVRIEDDYLVGPRPLSTSPEFLVEL